MSLLTPLQELEEFMQHTNRFEFINENLKINMNILESCIDNPKIKIINLEVVVSTQTLKIR